MTPPSQSLSQNTPSLGSPLAEAIARVGRRLRVGAFSRSVSTTCLIKAEATIGADADVLRGYVVRLSSKEATFRAARLTVERRNRAKARIEIAGRTLMGAVMQSTDFGYRLRFAEPLSEETVRACLAQSRVSTRR